MDESLLNSLLQHTFDSGASDLHLRTGQVPQIRVSGAFQKVSETVLTAEHMEEVIDSLDLNDNLRETFRQNNDLDCGISFGEGRVRVSLLQDINGYGAVFRSLPSNPPLLSDLGLPEIVTHLTSFNSGLVLVTGATGSGKSTTLAAMVNEINRTQSKHIITLEDPVEFIHSNIHSIITQREIGRNSNSFSTALRGALRQDPNVILVGELRDRETMSLALKAAETGHLVLATAHTKSAPGAIARLIGEFPADEQNKIRTTLSTALRGVIAQILLPQVHEPGLVAAVEIMTGDNSVDKHILNGKDQQLKGAIQTGKQFGMVTMEQSMKNLRDNGMISDFSIPQEYQADVLALD